MVDSMSEEEIYKLSVGSVVIPEKKRILRSYQKDLES